MPDLIKLASNHFAFHWSFPEIVADQMSFFERAGIKILWTDVTPSHSVNKSSMYIDILESGIADLYHAADWVCIERTTKSKKGWMVAKSPARAGNLNSSFTLFAAPGSGIDDPEKFLDKQIAVDLGTGSYYTAMQDLSRYLPREKIKLVQMGEPSQRLVALLENRVSGASLLSPWSDIARELGMTEVLKTGRTGSTVLVSRRDLDPDTLSRFFLGLNRSIEQVDITPDECRGLYFTLLEEILKTLPQSVQKAATALRETIPVPSWSPWVEYTEEDFQQSYSWMEANGFAVPGLKFSEVADLNSRSLFSNVTQDY